MLRSPISSKYHKTLIFLISIIFYIFLSFFFFCVPHPEPSSLLPYFLYFSIKISHLQHYLIVKIAIFASKVTMSNVQFSQFSHSVVSNSLPSHESQHARPPCPSPTPGVHSDSCPSSQWCRPAISSSVVPFSSCSQRPLASESFPMSQLFAWGGQSTGVSALASFLPKNILSSKSTGYKPVMSSWFACHSYIYFHCHISGIY